MSETLNTGEIAAGVVGLGLMGSSIATCLLIAGHPVKGVEPVADQTGPARQRIVAHLKKAYEEGLITESPEKYEELLTVSSDYQILKDCSFVVECTLEDPLVKKNVFEKVEAVISEEAFLTTNTSAIPISDLQKFTRIPARFYGLHWMIPAHTTRFLEVICGDQSEMAGAEWLYKLAHHWAKEPTLLRKDIRGFINNRLMYAMYREAFFLVENGYASVEDIDRAARNGPGYWLTMMGIFRWMDLTGIPAYHAVIKELFPTLANTTDVPELIDRIVKEGGKGVLNGHGFYEYTPEEARCWQEGYDAFSFELRKLALKYPVDYAEQKMKSLSESDKK